MSAGWTVVQYLLARAATDDGVMRCGTISALTAASEIDEKCSRGSCKQRYNSLQALRAIPFCVFFPLATPSVCPLPAQDLKILHSANGYDDLHITSKSTVLTLTVSI